ncbi:hypothetical protein [Hyalangium versicolor]|uniref:hypothetical protein n=1 Tax=Hyalangium versicolor TaxID=2861190 RepID=UPI001CCB4F23|nr:hypothetical protein [Hyalangium versicolor]
MNAAEAPLTLAWARVARPPDFLDLPGWTAAVTAEYATTEVSLERGIAEFLHAQIGHDSRELCGLGAEMTAPPEGLRFRISRTRTQAELAGQAVAALAEVLPMKELAARCELVVCSATSLDESGIFHSMIGGIVGTVGLSHVPHFAVSQLQGASLPGAVDIIDSMLTKPGRGALFIAAERWPVAFPRRWDSSTVLGDGAVAAWFTREEQPGLRYVGGTVRSFNPFIREPPLEVRPLPSFEVRGLPPLRGDSTGANKTPAPRARRSLTLDTPAMLDAAESVIADCLREHGVTPMGLSGWISSGLHPDVDLRLRERLGVRAPVFAPREDDGYWCAAAAPALLAELSDGVRTGRVRNDGSFLSWGMSYGGSVGAQLWCSVSGKEAQR